MRADEPLRPRARRRSVLRPAAASVAAAVVAACTGENLFTGAVTGGALLGPDVEITAPVPPVNIPPGDSVQVTANITADEGIAEVAWTGRLEEGGPDPFAPVVVPLAGVNDTTMSRFLRRTGTTAGAAEIIVTATDLLGETGADTISVLLGG